MYIEHITIWWKSKRIEYSALDVVKKEDKNRFLKRKLNGKMLIAEEKIENGILWIATKWKKMGHCGFLKIDIYKFARTH